MHTKRCPNRLRWIYSCGATPLAAPERDNTGSGGLISVTLTYIEAEGYVVFISADDNAEVAVLFSERCSLMGQSETAILCTLY